MVGGSRIVQARNIRNNDVVIASTSAEVVALLNKYAGTSASDPEYLKRVTIQLLPQDYEFTASQLPLKLRTDLSLVGCGAEKTRIISVQTTSSGAKNVIECRDLWSSGSGSAGPCRNVTVGGFSVIGDAYAPIAIYTKGLQNSIIRDIKITGMTASGSIGLALHAELSFGCYYNNIQSVDVGYAGSDGCGIGFQLKTTDLASQPKRVNSNSLLMCSAKFCVDAGYELNGCAAITMTACEAEQQVVGLRVLSCINTVVSGGYFENNSTGDIQLGTISGPAEASQQTVLIQPVLSSTNRLVGQSRGGTGDVYLLSQNGTVPSATKYDGNWMDKAYIAAFASLYAEFSSFASAVRVGYYKRSADANYRMEIFNDGRINFGGGSSATDVELSWAQANVLQLGTNDGFRLNGASGYLIFGSASGSAADVFLSRVAANILGLDTGDSFQVHGTGSYLFSSALGATADAGLQRNTATTCGTVSAINNCDIRVQGGFNTGRFRLGTNYLWVDASSNLRFHTSEPSADGDGVSISSGLSQAQVMARSFARC